MACLNTFACTSCSVNYIYSVDINSCISCPAGRFSAGGTSTLCTSCFAGCSTCTSSANNTCTGCLPQFYLVNSTCTACNNGSYSLGSIESTCTACSVGCTVCTNAIICSSCSATYGLNSLNNCILCLPGTYSLGGSTACLRFHVTQAAVLVLVLLRTHVNHALLIIFSAITVVHFVPLVHFLLEA